MRGTTARGVINRVFYLMLLHEIGARLGWHPERKNGDAARISDRKIAQRNYVHSDQHVWTTSGQNPFNNLHGGENDTVHQRQADQIRFAVLRRI